MASQNNGSLWEEWEECLQDLEATEDLAEGREGKTSPVNLNDGSPRKEHLEALHKYFGHSSFRSTQWQIIRSILEEKRDNCVVMATGSGKSLTYQFPAVFSNGLSIIISPLISLMQDQVLSLEMAKIPAGYLGSAQKDSRKVMADLHEGKLRVLYVTPEFCVKTDFFSDLKDKLKITLVAIDEAHCVSQWGHDFRADYRKLGAIRRSMPNVPFLAVTATATPAVRNDICKSLSLINPNIVCSSFDRPNLFLSVSVKSADIFADLRRFMVRTDNGRTYKFDGPTIIYCQTKKATEAVYSILKDNRLNGDFYHASRKNHERSEVHEKFIRDELDVIVATVAFGMGIDKPDVRYVIHYGAPKDIESYYQEIGRAGRDGQPSKCHVFFSPKDFQITQALLGSFTGDFLAHRQEMAKLMERYLDTTACRRQTLLHHFEGNSFKAGTNELKENCCDNCLGGIRRKRLGDSNSNVPNPSDLYDFTEDAELLLKTIAGFGSKGLNRSISCLRATKNSHIPNQTRDKELHGKGKHRSEEWWKALSRLLTREGLIEQKYIQFNAEVKSFPVPVVLLSSKGEKLLMRLAANRKETSVMLPPGQELFKLICKNANKSKAAAANDAESSSQSGNSDLILPDSLLSTSPESKTENSLFHYLLRVRKERANELNCAPFHLANNQAMIDLSLMRPSSVACFENGTVDGFNAFTIQRDGAFWISHIVKFCKENGLKMDEVPTSNSSESESDLPTTVRVTYTKFQKQQMTLEQLGAERNLARSTLINHLCEALKLGLPLDLPRAGVIEEVRDKIVQVIRSPPINSNISRMAPIKEKCPDFISYDQIRLVLAQLTGLYKKSGGQAANEAVPEKSNAVPNLRQFAATPSSSVPSSFKSASKEVQSQKTLNSLWPKTSSGSIASSSKNTFWKDQFSEDDKKITSANACEKENSNSLKESPPQHSDKKVDEPHHEGKEDLSFLSEIAWDEEPFETSCQDDAVGKHDIKVVGGKIQYEMGHSSGISQGNSDFSGKVPDIERSVSALESTSEPTFETELKRSSSLDVKCESEESPRPKRKLPGWISKATAQAEVVKRMKKNSLFKR